MFLNIGILKCCKNILSDVGRGTVSTEIGKTASPLAKTRHKAGEAATSWRNLAFDFFHEKVRL